MDEGSASGQDSCYGGASLAGAVIGTFLTTVLLLAVAALVYRQWRRHKGKHLVLVTNPEIVEDAYAFDNPCFKDATPAVTRNHDTRPLSTASSVVETPVKDSARWSSPWSSLGLPSVNKNDKRRTLDDSCLGSKATRVSVVSLRSRDFTGLGFNVCGNMREGIFVKDLLHRGPASESGRINPGDRIASVKISFRSMVYEDALTILSYASPYDVELEVETGGSGAGSRPTTLLKKSVGPSPSRICHPLYRSQSIPELSQAHKTTAKRLFIADPNESLGSNYSTMNSTMKSSKSTPGSQTLERRHEETKANNHHHQNHQKFGIKVLPALDGTVHRIENQNEHNTNLERRHSRKLDFTRDPSGPSEKESDTSGFESQHREAISERYQKRENNRFQEAPTSSKPVEKSSVGPDPSPKRPNGLDVPDMASRTEATQERIEAMNIPSEVPAEVHNAAMAARRNRRNSSELLSQPKSAAPEVIDPTDAKSPQKNKRKAPAPPRTTGSEPEAGRHPRREQSSPGKHERENPDDSIESITDYAESLNDYVGKIREVSLDDDAAVRRQLSEKNSSNRRSSVSDSDTDSEVHDSFTTIELKPADITIHHTPVPRVDGEPEENDEDDVYRKAASLGDLSKYEAKSLATLERAQSLDMADTGSKKRKVVPLPPEDINESTEDLTKLNDVDAFDRRKLKKSTEWGTLQDAIWNKSETEEADAVPRTRKRSSGTLERSKSAVEIKLKEEPETVRKTADGRIVPAEMPDDTSIELYNLPLSMRLTREFIDSERMFNPDEDNALARIVNNGTVVKSPTPEEMELDFRQAIPMSEEAEESFVKRDSKETSSEGPLNEELGMALRYFDLQISRATNPERSVENPRNLDRTDEAEPSGSPKRGRRAIGEDPMYAGRKEAQEEPMRKVTVTKRPCPGCERKFGQHDHVCTRQVDKNGEVINRDTNDWQPQEVSKLSESPTDERSAFRIGIKKFERVADAKAGSPTESRIERQLLRERGVELDDEEEEGYDFGSGHRAKTSSPANDRHNVSSVSVSSGENSEDSGLVGESGEYRRDSRPPLPETPMPRTGSPQKLTYITEIKVSTSRENLREGADEPGEASPRKDAPKPPRNEVTVTSNGKSNAGKKPPVPPRRNDASKIASREAESGDKAVVYVSEYKSTGGERDRNENTEKIGENKQASKKFEHWIFLGDNREQNPWGNGSSQSQTVTNIVVAPGDKKNLHQ